MKITTAAKVNRYLATYRKAITLSASLKRRAEYLRKAGHGHCINDSKLNAVLIDLKEYSSRLDNNEFINPPKWVHWPVEDVMTYVMGHNKPGPKQYNEFEAAIAQTMAESGQRQRASQHTWQLQAELAYRHKLGWAFTFNTLTVADEHYYDVFSPESLAFRNYIRHIERLAAKRAAIPRAQATQHHRYFAVIEEGSKTGRLHLHVLHMTSHLLTTSDPNQGSAWPTKREMPSLKRYWPYGWSSPIAVRYSLGDAYSQAGWRWPLDSKTGKGIPVRQIGAVGGYMAKYILKAYTSTQRNEYQWRVKKSRNLGQALLSELTANLTNQTLEIICSLPTIRARMNKKTIPPTMLQQSSLAALQNRQSLETMFQSLKHFASDPSLLHVASGLIQPTPGLNQPSAGNILTTNLSAEAISKAQDELQTAANKLTAKYYGDTIFDVTTLSTRHHSA